MAVINGDDSANSLNGTDAPDFIYGYGGNDTLTAVGSADNLYGGAGDDVLVSGTILNWLYGGDGIDTVDYSHASHDLGGVVATIGGGGGHGPAEGDSISSDIENITGTVFDDLMFGSSADNVLRGGPNSQNDGADELHGEDGNDQLFGDGANDWLYGEAGADILYGGVGEDAVRGGDGNDYLEGGGGADFLVGGAGSDTASYLLSPAGVVVAIGGYGSGGEAEGDLVGPDVENILGSIRADVLTGSDADNTIFGESPFALAGGDDVLSGLGGNDALHGCLGNDILRGGTGADTLYGDDGIDTASYFTSGTGVVVNLATGTGRGGEAQGDTLTDIEVVSGSQGNDSIVGDTGANTLQGWGGNDVLVGAGGADILTGGAGADRFVYGSAAQSMVGVNADRITDFSHAQGDRIDLAAIDARTTVAGDQAFSFIGTGLYTGAAGQLRYAVDGGVTTVAGDLNGDKVSDFHITLAGSVALAAADFVL
ncbi:MAG: calcium-binding protein [Inquilinus limosus]|uniref:Calcium-binding protein n=1 Tax=Inquilinus limosus TaxID=171674 RepID=A0A952FUB3_9PROT|nr:calcium-binding protein [Inquilinus limosus]